MKEDYKKYLITTGLIWSGCLVLFLIIYIFVVGPQKQTRKQIFKTMVEKEELCNQSLKITTDEVSNYLETEINELHNDLDGFTVDFEDSANLTFDISQIASKNGLKSFTIKSKEDTTNATIPTKNDYKYLVNTNIDVSFTSGFNQFAMFLNALERYRPIIFVDNFIITRSEKDNFGHRIDMELSVLVKKPQDG